MPKPYKSYVVVSYDRRTGRSASGDPVSDLAAAARTAKAIREENGNEYPVIVWATVFASEDAYDNEEAPLRAGIARTFPSVSPSLKTAQEKSADPQRRLAPAVLEAMTK